MWTFDVFSYDKKRSRGWPLSVYETQMKEFLLTCDWICLPCVQNATTATNAYAYIFWIFAPTFSRHRTIISWKSVKRPHLDYSLSWLQLSVHSSSKELKKKKSSTFSESNFFKVQYYQVIAQLHKCNDHEKCWYC